MWFMLIVSRDKCGPLLGFLSKSRYTAYSEGWALYAESPLVAEDTGEL